MLHSMTGYGTTTIEINDLIFDIELKTLNSRYLDNKIYLPQILLSNEIELSFIGLARPNITSTARQQLIKCIKCNRRGKY